MGSFAFAHCKNLKVVRFLTCMTPVAGTGVFAGDDVTIFVPYDAQAAFKTAFITHADRIQSQEIPVTFIDSGETVADRIAYYGQTIADLPQRESPAIRSAGGMTIKTLRARYMSKVTAGSRKTHCNCTQNGQRGNLR